jgi:hypothetical protein
MPRRLLVTAGILLGAACAPLAACNGGRSDLGVPIPDAGTDAPPDVDAGGPPPLEVSDKVDLLLVVDNSPNTDAFQGLFGATLPYLLDRFARPACVNGLGNVVTTTAAPTDPCPVGQREFHPLTDLHVGVITTSLGGHGADTCSPVGPSWNPTQNDGAHLVTRGPGTTIVSTYQGQGFLAWDPAQALSPPGDPDIGDLAQQAALLVTGTGSQGCGFEASLESIYRFLVDPAPYLSLAIVGGQATPLGVDTALLQQRSDFLRPDSALVIVLITDEDDCSVQDGAQYFYVLQSLTPGDPGQAFQLPRARTVCAADPLDPCCASCDQAAPPGCPPDPVCQDGPLDAVDDPLNLRCFDQKRRFGVDFLYPVQRYVDALTSPLVAARDGSMVPNPLYTGGRSPDLVMMAGILGVPWQDVAKYPKSLVEGYAPADEIDWTLLLGDPDGGKPPGDPLMIKSIDPRTGVDPRTGAPLSPPQSGRLANPINGHERTISGRDDLQYACIYARPSPTSCASGSCNCVGADLVTNPACQAPDGSYGTTEYYARALPSTRPLQVLRALGDRASVASICAETTSGPDAPTFAYKPAADAILRTLRPRLR